MARDLKVWGVNPSGRQRVIVATRTQAEAARLVKMSLYSFRQYAAVTGNKADIALAMSEPGKVFLKN